MLKISRGCGSRSGCIMSMCNLSSREQELGAAGGVAEGLGVIWASVICPSVNRREEQQGVWQKDLV